MKPITILGSTGTIGINTLKLVDRFKGQFEVVGLTGGSNTALLAEQVIKFRPRCVAVKNVQAADDLKARLAASDSDVEILYDASGICEVAANPQSKLTVSGIVGFAAIAPTLAAIEAGSDIALANKEAIIAAGPIITDPAKKLGVRILPVDSEHSAIFQALNGENGSTMHRVSRLILTASGGPFLHTPKSQLKHVTHEQALKHPTWKMGAKISIDSSTMMNKGLEVIEATRLFNVEAKNIDIQVHPESIIHSMIEYIDGSIIAQLGVSDMQGPISYALAFPERLPKALPSLNLTEIGKLTFFDPDFEKFPCLGLAYDAAKLGKSLPLVLNGANEICVDAFLQGKIKFTEIPRFIEKVMNQHSPEVLTSLDQVIALDHWSRQRAQTEIMRSK